MVQRLDTLSVIGLIVVVEWQLYCFAILRVKFVQLLFEVRVIESYFLCCCSIRISGPIIIGGDALAPVTCWSDVEIIAKG
jgi:hypothetical protein